MKKALIVFAIAAAFFAVIEANAQKAPAAGQNSAVRQEWFTDWKKATRESRKTGKAIFALFTGSDWCPWCVKLQKEILSTPQFKNYAGEKLVLFKADFTRNPPPERKLLKQNSALARQFSIGGYPTVILLTPAGKVAGKTGYRRGGPDPYVRHLETILKQK